MFDTYVTIVGNVLTAPEWRRTQRTKSLVANFKVASTARRLNRETGRWIDGNSLRVRVNCWRRLAEGVASSIMVGDPVVVVGRMYTRDWTDGDGNHRTLYELEAVAVGHDLSRGRARFMRNKPAASTSETEEAEAEARVRGEETEAVPVGQEPARRGELGFDEDDEFAGLPAGPFDAPAYDGVAELRGAAIGFPGAESSGDELGGGDVDALDAEAGAPAPDDVEHGLTETEHEAPESGRARRGRGRATVPA